MPVTPKIEAIERIEVDNAAEARDSAACLTNGMELDDKPVVTQNSAIFGSSSERQVSSSVAQEPLEADPSITTIRTSLEKRHKYGTQTLSHEHSDTIDGIQVDLKTQEPQASEQFEGATPKGSDVFRGKYDDDRFRNSQVELSLRQQLKQSEQLISLLTKQNDELTKALEQERSHITDLEDQLRSGAAYSHQVSRLNRVFRDLGVQLPSIDEEVWDSRLIAESIRQQFVERDLEKIQEYGEITTLECIKLLFGNAEVELTDKDNTMRFVFKNNELKRELAFWLSWNDKTFTYTKIKMEIPEKDLPLFWPEERIEFEVRQGPKFIIQALGSVFNGGW